MWNTPLGQRTLRGAEARLFCAAANHLLDDIWDFNRLNHPSDIGIDAFDNLSPGQQVMCLIEVTAALFRDHVASPMPTRANEATIAAVFETALTRICVEIDDGLMGDVSWVSMAQAAITETTDEEDEAAVPIQEDGEDEWESAMELLCMRILHDQDYLIEATLDLPPEQAAAINEQIGISQEYESVPNDPSRSVTHQLITVLRGFLDDLTSRIFSTPADQGTP